MKSKKAEPIGMMHLSKGKFAVTANALILFILLHNLVGARIGSPWFFNIFVLVLVYFLSSAAYTVYFDVIEK